MKTEVNYIHTEVSLVPTQHFFISRILGCSYDYAEAFDYYISKYGHYNHIEQILNHTKKQYRIMFHYDIPSYDAYKIQEWSKPYFAYLLDINILAFDDNNYIKPNDFLTKDSENELITSMLKYMEEGITDKEISFTINSNRVGFKKIFICFIL